MMRVLNSYPGPRWYRAAAVVKSLVLDASGSSDVDRRWEGVVGRLRAVDVIVGVYRLMAA